MKVSESRNINVLGRYALELDESVAGGGLRPLREPDEAVDEYEFPAEAPSYGS